MNAYNSFKTALYLLMLVVGAHTVTAAADELYVITGAATALTADDVRDVFLGEKLVSQGTKLIPVDNSAAQAAFLAKVMGLDAAKYASIWTKKGFRDGLTTPDTKSSDVDVIAYVRRVPGAVGYVTTYVMPLAGIGVRVVKKY